MFNDRCLLRLCGERFILFFNHNFHHVVILMLWAFAWVFNPWTSLDLVSKILTNIWARYTLPAVRLICGYRHVLNLKPVFKLDLLSETLWLFYYLLHLVKSIDLPLNCFNLFLQTLHLSLACWVIDLLLECALPSHKFLSKVYGYFLWRELFLDVVFIRVNKGEVILVGWVLLALFRFIVSL